MTTTAASKWLTQEEAADYLGVSIPTIKNYRSKGLPFYKVGSLVRLKREEIDAWVENGRQVWAD